MKVLPSILMLALCLPLSAMAGAGEGATSSGGADVVVKANGKIQIADPYSTDLRSHIIELGLQAQTFEQIAPPEVQAEMVRIARLVNAYGETRAVDENTFIALQIRDAKNKYYFTDQIPALPECQEKLTYDRLPSGARTEQVACTSGRDTLIVRALYDGLVSREKALLLAHEGMRRLPKTMHAWIPHVSNGLGAALEIAERQASASRDELLAQPLPGRQVALLTRLYEGVMSTGLAQKEQKSQAFDDEYPSEISRRGGALVSKRVKSVHPSAYLGVGLFVPPRATVEENVFVVNSTVGFNLRDGDEVILRKDASVRSSQFWLMCGYDGWHSPSAPCQAILGEGVAVSDSSITRLWARKPGAKVSAARVKTWGLLLDENSQVSDIEVETRGGALQLEANAELARFKGVLFISDGSLLKDFLTGLLTLRTGVSGLVVKAGVKLDFNGEIVCESGRNHFISKTMFEDVRSEQDVRAICAKP